MSEIREDVLLSKNNQVTNNHLTSNDLSDNALSGSTLAEKHTATAEAGPKIEIKVDPSSSIENAVKTTVSHYLISMEGHPITDLYDTVLRAIEEPLLETVLTTTSNNQSEAAKLLGLNRGTLRKKLKRYGLL